MTFEHPFLLILLAGILPYAVIALRVLSKIRACSGNYSPVEAARWASFRSRRAAAFALGAVFYVSSVLALVDPSLGTRYVTEQVRDVETVFVLDVSNSMAAKDGADTRLSVAASFIRAIVAATPGTRNALYAFKGTSVLLVPPTSSVLAFEDALSWATPDAMTSSGSNVGQALSAANRKGGAGLARVIVLLTDGNDTGLQAADACKAVVKSGVHLCIVGLGGSVPSAVFLPDGSEVRDLQGNPVLLASNDAEMRRWSILSGCEYAKAEASGSLAFVIDYVLKNSVLLGRARSTAVPASLQYYCILAAAISLLFAGILSAPFTASKPPTKQRGKVSAILVFTSLLPLFFSCGRLSEDFGVMKANSLFSDSRYNEAIALYLSAEKTNKEESLSYNVANAFVALGEFDSALPLYEKITKSGDASLAAAAWYNMGLAWHKMESYDNALAAYRESLLLVPSDPDACRAYELSLSARRQKESESAKERARATDGPGSEAAMFSLSRKAHTELFVPGLTSERRTGNDH